jgi:hypothetical protein
MPTELLRKLSVYLADVVSRNIPCPSLPSSRSAHPRGCGDDGHPRQRFPHGSGELADPLISLLDREGWTGEAGTTLPAFAKAGALDEPQRTQLAARLADQLLGRLSDPSSSANATCARAAAAPAIPDQVRDVTDQRSEPAERQINLGLRAAGAERRHPRRLINCVVQNSRLAHPGLALDHQRRTPAALTSLEQLTDAMALAIAPD